jgi:DNA repair exonuclease SbcCD ATPase subunit
MVSQISELRAKLEESETALAEAKASLAKAKASANATIGLLTAIIDGFEAKSSEEATCPLCSKTFFEGGFHPASQKLWQHMGAGKMHRKTRQKMLWNKRWELIKYNGL